VQAAAVVAGGSSSCVARSELRVPQQADSGEEELRGL